MPLSPFEKYNCCTHLQKVALLGVSDKVAQDNSMTYSIAPFLISQMELLSCLAQEEQFIQKL